MSVDAYRLALRKLLVGWKMAAERGVEVDASDVSTLTLVYPWVAQTHRFGRAFLRLEKDGLEHESHPIVRAALEYALMAHWVAITGDSAVVGRYAEDHRLLEAMVTEAAGSRRDVAPTTWDIETLRALVDERAPTGVDEEKLNRKAEVCDSIGVKNSLYPAYRLHCWFTHPTTLAAGLYLKDLGENRFGLLDKPSTGTQTGLVSMMAHCVFWSRRVLDDLTKHHPNREWLDEIGGSIQVVQRLPERQP